MYVSNALRIIKWPTSTSTIYFGLMRRKNTCRRLRDLMKKCGEPQGSLHIMAKSSKTAKKLILFGDIRSDPIKHIIAVFFLVSSFWYFVCLFVRFLIPYRFVMNITKLLKLFKRKSALFQNLPLMIYKKLLI